MDDTTPSPEIKLLQVKLWYQKPMIWIGIGVAGCLVLLAMPHVMRVYHQWSGKRALQRATAAYAKGSYQEAFLDARAALAGDPRDVEATRILAKTAEALGIPQAVDLRRQVDALQPGDPENLLSLAEDCLKTGDSAAAAEALKGLKESDRKSARYHDVAGSIALSNNRPPLAEAEWQQACQLDPRNDDYRLKSAKVQLNLGGAGVRAAALAVLEELKGKGPQRLAALRVLVGDALSHGETARARSLATELAADPQATFTEKLIRLATLKKGKAQEFSTLSIGQDRVDPEFVAALVETQQAAVKPDQIYQLVRWMNDNQLALQVPEWTDKLPKEIVEKMPVCAAVADAYARALDWKTVKEKVEKVSWQQADFLRLGLLARALDRLGDVPGSRAAWSKALEIAQNKPEYLEALFKELPNWSWEARSNEILLQLTRTDRCPRWALDEVWKNALKKGDTQELFRVSKAILKADPKGVFSRNNYINLGLLSGQDPNVLQPLAEALARENPANPTVVSTYALALYQQGQVDAAISAMEKISPEQLRASSFALYYGIFLAATGQAERAEEYLRLGADAHQLPEEKNLADFLRSAVRARVLERSGDGPGSAAAWTEAVSVAQANPDWLEMLGKMALQWGWKEQTGKIALKLADAGRCPRWAADSLWSAALSTGDSGQIYKVSKLIRDADPTSLTARTNFTLVALLGDRDGDTTQRLAESLARENPDNGAAAAAQGFSLLLQGRIDEALALLATLPPEQRQDPPVAFYRGLILAAAGQTAPATEALELGRSGLRFPEEKALGQMVQLGLQACQQDGASDPKAADGLWSSALGVAQKHSDWLEVLGRLAQKAGSPQRAEMVLWKLADNPGCPAWAINYLAESAEKNHDASQLYKINKLKFKADPKNRAARTSYIFLALLTGHDEDTPHRLAETLSRDNPNDAEVSITYGLSLYQRGRENEAVALLAALPPAQLREPRTAFYYGIFLGAAGQNAKAEEYLQIGANAPLLPEEKALLGKGKLQAQAGASR